MKKTESQVSIHTQGEETPLEYGWRVGVTIIQAASCLLYVFYANITLHSIQTWLVLSFLLPILVNFIFWMRTIYKIEMKYKQIEIRISRRPLLKRICLFLQWTPLGIFLGLLSKFQLISFILFKIIHYKYGIMLTLDLVKLIQIQPSSQFQRSRRHNNSMPTQSNLILPPLQLQIPKNNLKGMDAFHIRSESDNIHAQTQPKSINTLKVLPQLNILKANSEDPFQKNQLFDNSNNNKKIPGIEIESMTPLKDNIQQKNNKKIHPLTLNIKSNNENKPNQHHFNARGSLVSSAISNAVPDDYSRVITETTPIRNRNNEINLSKLNQNEGELSSKRQPLKQLQARRRRRQDSNISQGNLEGVNSQVGSQSGYFDQNYGMLSGNLNGSYSMIPQENLKSDMLLYLTANQQFVQRQFLRERYFITLQSFAQIIEYCLSSIPCFILQIVDSDMNIQDYSSLVQTITALSIMASGCAVFSHSFQLFQKMMNNSSGDERNNHLISFFSVINQIKQRREQNTNIAKAAQEKNKMIASNSNQQDKSANVNMLSNKIPVISTYESPQIPNQKINLFPHVPGIMQDDLIPKSDDNQQQLEEDMDERKVRHQLRKNKKSIGSDDEINDNKLQEENESLKKGLEVDRINDLSPQKLKKSNFSDISKFKKGQAIDSLGFSNSVTTPKSKDVVNFTTLAASNNSFSDGHQHLQQIELKNIRAFPFPKKVSLNALEQIQLLATCSQQSLADIEHFQLNLSGKNSTLESLVGDFETIFSLAKGISILHLQFSQQKQREKKLTYFFEFRCNRLKDDILFKLINTVLTQIGSQLSCLELSYDENMTTTKGEFELRDLITAWDFRRKGKPQKKIVGDQYICYKVALNPSEQLKELEFILEYQVNKNFIQIAEFNFREINCNDDIIDLVQDLIIDSINLHCFELHLNPSDSDLEGILATENCLRQHSQLQDGFLTCDNLIMAIVKKKDVQQGILKVELLEDLNTFTIEEWNNQLNYEVVSHIYNEKINLKARLNNGFFDSQKIIQLGDEILKFSCLKSIVIHLKEGEADDSFLRKIFCQRRSSSSPLSSVELKLKSNKVKLEIETNKILANSFSKCSHLILHFENNLISQENALNLVSLLSQLKELIYISINFSSNEITSFGEIQKEFNNAIEQCPNIQKKVLILDGMKQKNPLNITLALDSMEL